VTKKKPTAFEIANTCNSCGQQMERGAVMVCHACAGKSQIHPTPLKIGETIRWKKDDSPVLEKSPIHGDRTTLPRSMEGQVKRLLDALHAHHNNDESPANCAACKKVLAP
jgi:hypothetical protein